MTTKMDFDVVFAGHDSSADWAGVFFETRMDGLVPTESGLIGKASSADVALKIGENK